MTETPRPSSAGKVLSFRQDGAAREGKDVHVHELIGAFTRLFEQVKAANDLLLGTSLSQHTKSDIGGDLVQAATAAFAANTKLAAELIKQGLDSPPDQGEDGGTDGENAPE